MDVQNFGGVAEDRAIQDDPSCSGSPLRGVRLSDAGRYSAVFELGKIEELDFGGSILSLSDTSSMFGCSLSPRTNMCSVCASEIQNDSSVFYAMGMRFCSVRAPPAPSGHPPRSRWKRWIPCDPGTKTRFGSRRGGCNQARWAHAGERAGVSQRPPPCQPQRASAFACRSAARVRGGGSVLKSKSCCAVPVPRRKDAGATPCPRGWTTRSCATAGARWSCTTRALASQAIRGARTSRKVTRSSGETAPGASTSLSARGRGCACSMLRVWTLSVS